MKHSTQRSTTSSPRFSRGLALLLVAGLLAPLAVSGWRQFIGNGFSHPLAAQASPEVQPEPKVEFLADSCLERSPREIVWRQTFAKIAALEDADRREELWENFAAQIPVADIPATLGELQSLGYGEGEVFQRLVRRWARANGRAAAAWAEQLPSGSPRAGALSDVAVEWAGTDFPSTVAWARQLSDAVERQTSLLAAAGEAVRTEPVEALRIAVALPADAARDETIRRAASEWASQDAAGAVDWAKQIPDATLRSQILAAEAVAWSESAPEAAATLAVDSLAAGRLQDDTVISIVQRWAQQQPAAAAAWVEQFPEGELRTVAEENLLAQIPPTGAVANNF